MRIIIPKYPSMHIKNSVHALPIYHIVQDNIVFHVTYQDSGILLQKNAKLVDKMHISIHP